MRSVMRPSGFTKRYPRAPKRRQRVPIDEKVSGRWTWITPIGTAVAIIMSLGSLGWHVWGRLQGPQTVLLPPKQVSLVNLSKCSKKNRHKSNFEEGQVGGPFEEGDKKNGDVTIVSSMAYVNKSQHGFNSIVSEEKVFLKINCGGIKCFFSNAFVDTYRDSYGVVHVNRRNSFQPFPVMAANSESHETIFYGGWRNCKGSLGKTNLSESYLYWNDVVKKLKPGDIIEFKLEADIVEDDKPLNQICRVTLNRDYIRLFFSYDCAVPLQCDETD